MFVTVPFTYTAYGTIGRRVPQPWRIQSRFEIELPERSLSEASATLRFGIDEPRNERFEALVFDRTAYLPVLNESSDALDRVALSALVEKTWQSKCLSTRFALGDPLFDRQIWNVDAADMKRNPHVESGDVRELVVNDRDEQLAHAWSRAGRILLVDGVVYSSRFQPYVAISGTQDPRVALVDLEPSLNHPPQLPGSVHIDLGQSLVIEETVLSKGLEGCLPDQSLLAEVDWCFDGLRSTLSSIATTLYVQLSNTSRSRSFPTGIRREEAFAARMAYIRHELDCGQPFEADTVRQELVEALAFAEKYVVSEYDQIAFFAKVRLGLDWVGRMQQPAHLISHEDEVALSS